MRPDVGDPVPDIALETPEGGCVRPSDFAGRKLVLFFYPKDDTPGCTTEACGFRDAIASYRKLDVPVTRAARGARSRARPPIWPAPDDRRDKKAA